MNQYNDNVYFRLDLALFYVHLNKLDKAEDLLIPTTKFY